MRILILSTNSDEAGAPKHVEMLVNGLESEFEFVLIFGEDGPVSERLKSRGHIVHIVKEMRTAISPFRDLIALYKILHIVRHHNPDIVHCHSAKAGLLGRICALILRKKWIYTVHGWGWRGVSIGKKKVIIFIEFWLSKLPRGFYIFVAKAVRDDAEKVLGLSKDKGIVIFNGVPRVKVVGPSENIPLTIMMPARVSNAKDHLSLVMAFELFNYENSCLLLCGTGTDSEKFINMVKNIAPKTFSRIIFSGQVTAIEKMYSQSHIVALISKFEALPLSIIEAMSCKKAIIATNVGGIPELITDDFSGILVRQNSTTEIAAAMQRYTSSEVRDSFGYNANKVYEENFTEEKMISSITSIYYSREIFQL